MAQVAHKDNFKQLVEGPVTVVDFWAPWCGPCKMMAPVMDQLEAEYGDRIKFVKFNIDEDQESGLALVSFPRRRGFFWPSLLSLCRECLPKNLT
ncbi:thioredoxin family protein [Limosilactobacillus fermentum]